MSCPTCDKETDKKYRPFCSKRCSDIDLGKWFDGTYAIASDDDEDVGELAKVLDQPPAKPH